MNKYWKMIGMSVVAAGALYYPIMRLVKYLAKKGKEQLEGQEDVHVKAFAPAYRGGKHVKPHHKGNHN
jgi:hypothetical protein